MGDVVTIGNRRVGVGEPCWIAIDIGVNHQGDLDIAKRLIDVCADAGVDSCKFQRRTPELQVPPEKWDVLRDSPFGVVKTIEYRRRIEFSDAQYVEIRDHCHKRGVQFFASAWDLPALESLERLDVPCHKVASAKLVDDGLLLAIRDTDKPVLVSTGMSTMYDVDSALDLFLHSKAKGEPAAELVLLHCISDYPAEDGVLNLRVIDSLRNRYCLPVGYSSHEVGLLPSIIAVARFGACVVERHGTLNRGWVGSDHGASLEPVGIKKLVRDIRRAEALIKSDGIKRITEGEQKQIARLRL